MLINEVAKLTGLSVRTLQYYHKIGLLTPDSISKAGYRHYSQANLVRLQQIMFYKELGFSLDDIANMIDKAFDKNSALENHKHILIKKKTRLENIIKLIDDIQKQGTKLSFKEFNTKEITMEMDKYAQEAKQRWGNTDAYKESQKRTKGLSKDEWNSINDAANKIFEAFAQIKDGNPASPQAKSLVQAWQSHINTNFYPCDNQMLLNLAQMYKGDSRFKATMDKFGEGTTDFICKAIEEYCK